MYNTGKLIGRTALITGASRGIGKEIAVKLAKDGANIVIAAKTATPHSKLSGTIYTAAEEVEKAGGQALPCIVDVRSEESVQQCVEEAVKKFGGIDILINNASAISLTSTLDTDMKRYDLMHSINTRGTFLMSKTCIPYLKQGKNPHILNISPPLLMEPRWFGNHVAYTMAKYGMSMCVLGMAEELKKDGIAVNALWPLTAIWTAAMEMLTQGEGAAGSRKPDIMADAAYVILNRNSSNFSGHFTIDENILREEGEKNFEKYAVVPGAPLMPDFFISEGDAHSLFSTTSASRKKSRETIENSLKGKEVDDVISSLKKVVNQEIVKSMGATFQFHLSDSETKNVWLDLKNSTGDAGIGSLTEKADVVFESSAGDFVRMFQGTLSPTAAFMTKKLKISGNMNKALKLEQIMKKMKK